MKNEVILAKTSKDIEAIEKETREFECPCCLTKLQFRTRISITSVGLALTSQEMADRDNRPLELSAESKAKIALAVEYAELITQSKRLGILDAFNQAIDAKTGTKPTDRELYFVKWLNTASKQKTPTYALRQCLSQKDLDAGGDLELWGWQDVSVILQNGLFKVFIPKALINGSKIERLTVSANGIGKTGVNIGGAVAPAKIDLTYWVRTRFGYIERSAEFANELRKHSIGAFCV